MFFFKATYTKTIEENFEPENYILSLYEKKQYTWTYFYLLTKIFEGVLSLKSSKAFKEKYYEIYSKEAIRIPEINSIVT